jgi:hypothetical protein
MTTAHTTTANRGTDPCQHPTCSGERCTLDARPARWVPGSGSLFLTRYTRLGEVTRTATGFRAYTYAPNGGRPVMFADVLAAMAHVETEAGEG